MIKGIENMPFAIFERHHLQKVFFRLLPTNLEVLESIRSGFLPYFLTKPGRKKEDRTKQLKKTISFFAELFFKKATPRETRRRQNSINDFRKSNL